MSSGASEIGGQGFFFFIKACGLKKRFQCDEGLSTFSCTFFYTYKLYI